jgi:hypothetical protein
VNSDTTSKETMINFIIVDVSFVKFLCKFSRIVDRVEVVKVCLKMEFGSVVKEFGSVVKEFGSVVKCCVPTSNNRSKWVIRFVVFDRTSNGGWYAISRM